jgi:4-hydroxy-2-oxoheptanedioate aldolase
MCKSELRRIIADGKTVLDAWLAIANPFSAELMAHQGFDAVTIDLQHGPVDFQAAVGMLAAISTTPAVPMVRVPWNEPILTAKLLDAGAYGVFCPMINSKAEAEALVGACRYPPRGARSFGPNRALLYGGADLACQKRATMAARCCNVLARKAIFAQRRHIGRSADFRAVLWCCR